MGFYILKQTHLHFVIATKETWFEVKRVRLSVQRRCSESVCDWIPRRKLYVHIRCRRTSLTALNNVFV